LGGRRSKRYWMAYSL